MILHGFSYFTTEILCINLNLLLSFEFAYYKATLTISKHTFATILMSAAPVWMSLHQRYECADCTFWAADIRQVNLVLCGSFPNRSAAHKSIRLRLQSLHHFRKEVQLCMNLLLWLALIIEIHPDANFILV